MTKPLLLAFAAFVAGCITGLVLVTNLHDWSMSAHAGEKKACNELPDMAAFYVRKPGESHSVESCQYVAHYGDREWVPALGKIALPGQGVKGKPGLEQQLKWVREECRKRAKQLKQRC